MQGKRIRRAKRRVGHFVILMLMVAVLTAVVFARMAEPHESIAEASAGASSPTVEIEQITPVPQSTYAQPLSTLAPVTSETIAETPEVASEVDHKPTVNDRYAELTLTEEDMEMLAAIVFLEAGNQSAEGQQAVAEVVLNRVIANNFPDTVYEVIYQGLGTKKQQFTPAGKVSTTTPNAEQYDAVNAALYGESILPVDVVYFSTSGENSRVWGKIGGHVFCYQYIWG